MFSFFLAFLKYGTYLLLMYHITQKALNKWKCKRFHDHTHDTIGLEFLHWNWHMMLNIHIRERPTFPTNLLSVIIGFVFYFEVIGTTDKPNGSKKNLILFIFYFLFIRNISEVNCLWFYFPSWNYLIITKFLVFSQIA